MVWLGLLSAVAVMTAVAAWTSVRRLKRKLELLQQSYWDLRYEHGRLKAQMKRLDPETAADPQDAPAASTTFIPLSSLKR